MPDNSYQFRAPPTVRSDNRVNTSGKAPASEVGKGSLRYANIVAAGQTLPIPCSGTQFYLRVATAAVQIRPTGGVFSEYVQGQGLNLSIGNTFDKLEVKNTNSFPVVFELFVGFDGFIDNILILSTSVNNNVAFPTAPLPTATNINFTDKSGTQFTDINNRVWYAISRVAIVISNVDSGVTYLLQKFGSVVSNGPAVLAIFPLTSIRLDLGGNYCMNVGGAAINVIACEIYQAIPAT